MRLIDADELRIKPEYMHDICGETMIRVEDVARIINEMPTIDPQPQWIPCSEKPKETVKVLVQADDMYYNMNNDTGILIGWRNGNKWSTLTTKGWESIRYPIAWMPLPEPYKKKE